MDKIWEKHRPYVELLSQMNNSCIFVAERHESYLYLSPNFGDFFGYKLEELESSHDSDFLERRIHPDDLQILGSMQIRLLNYICSLPEDEQKSYKHIFEFRVLGKNNEYIRIISQHQILDTSPKGNPILLGVVDISPDQTKDTGIRFTLMNFKTGEIIPFDINDNTENNLTKREMEILKLINDGMYSKEISGKLFISIHTVNRHRQNILEKMNVNNVQEAINYTRRLGLLA
ncbi:MAG: LuxR C-terminal-related transcriptional regulator [Dysgonomonas sp.]|nr:LuxR C-terminal-related transcriptional regulator [Dysgonomonas sp.]